MNRFQLEVAFHTLNRKDYDEIIIPIFEHGEEMREKSKRIFDFDNDEYKTAKKESIHYDKILDNLYLGAFEARFDPTFGAIVTLVSPPEFRYISQTHPISLEHTNQVLVIPISDAGDDKIGPHLQNGIDFITKHIKDKKVLVHCMAGISRSPSMVIAYLMSTGMDMPKAYWHVRDKREIISPYPAFIKEIADHFKEKEGQKKHDPSYLSEQD